MPGLLLHEPPTHPVNRGTTLNISISWARGLINVPAPSMLQHPPGPGQQGCGRGQRKVNNPPPLHPQAGETGH